MIWKKGIQEAEAFWAGDKTWLRELLHPAKDAAGARLPYSLAYATLAPGAASLPHRLKESAEVYFILSGHGLIEIEDSHRTIAAGDTAIVPPNALQSVRNEGSEPLSFLCIVSPPWREEDEEIDRL